jgi:hypothetical protein
VAMLKYFDLEYVKEKREGRGKENKKYSIWNM